MPRRSFDHRSESGLWLYGLHPVRAALANPGRRLHRALLTESASRAVGPQLLAKVRHQIVSSGAVAQVVPAGVTHQGAALLCDPLVRLDLDRIVQLAEGARRVVAVLDQVLDPHNVGAILRSAAAFGLVAVVVQDRHAPPQSGTLAKAASGALDHIPYIEVVNIARTLEQLGRLGFWRLALTGDADRGLGEIAVPGDVAVVLGSEGVGIRRLVRERCDAAASIPVKPKMDSLNVSAAAAIAFYALRQGVNRR